VSEALLTSVGLGSQELLHLWVVIGIISVGVAGLTIAVVVPRVHHPREFL
jgi:hypothetical protein